MMLVSVICFYHLIRVFYMILIGNVFLFILTFVWVKQVLLMNKKYGALYLLLPSCLNEYLTLFETIDSAFCTLNIL